MYPDSFINEVRSAAGIVEIIGGYVNLRKRGRNHVGLCPFHTEKTPSFNVSEERQWFHCFGCGASGDIFRFLMRIDNLTFPEAVRWVAEKYALALPAPVVRLEEGDKDRQQILDATQAAEAFFKAVLLTEPEGQEARRYLLQRGLRDSTLEQFCLGYAPSGGGRLVSFLTEQGYPVEILEKAGLAKKSEMGKGFYDAFRRRVIFPIKDVRGKTVAFGGRVMDDGVPKYLNSPETVIYSKSRHLFGLCHAREAIREQNHAILVEGYLDCIIPSQEGVRNMIASLGTSLTSNQVRLLGRYTKNVVVNYDPDTAGVNAMRRSLELFLEEGFRVNVLRLPDGLDPDAFVRRHGAEAYRRQLKQCDPYLEFIADEALKNAGAGARSKLNAINAVLPILARIPDRVERLEFASRVSQRLGIEDSVILAEMRKAANMRSPAIDVSRVSNMPELLPAERELLQALLSDGELARQLIPYLESPGLEEMRSSRLLKEIVRLYREKGQADFAMLEKNLQGEEEMALLSELYFEKNMPSIRLQDGINRINALRKKQLEREMNRLQVEIRRAEADKDEAKLGILNRQKMEIIRQIYAL
jgi:DNA primase